MNIKCPKCGQKYEAATELIGQNVECQICNEQFIAKMISPRYMKGAPEETVSLPDAVDNTPDDTGKTTDNPSPSNRDSYTQQDKSLFVQWCNSYLLFHKSLAKKKLFYGLAASLAVLLTSLFLIHLSITVSYHQKLHDEKYLLQQYGRVYAKNYNKKQKSTANNKQVAKDSAKAKSLYDEGRKLYIEATGKTPRDKKKISLVAEKYLLAASLGNAEAQAGIGSFYMAGEGVSRNVNEGTKWLELAVAQGNADAMFSLGFAYAKGEGVLMDKKKGFDLVDKSAKLGFKPAQRVVANPEWYPEFFYR